MKNKQNHPYSVSKLYVFSGLVVFLALLTLVFNGSFSKARVINDMAKSETITNNQPLPNLSGDKAREYLREQGLYESLGEAMEAARYSINPTKNAPLPDTKEAFEANNPGQAFSTYFAEDGIHLVSKTKNNKWRVQMNLTGYGYGDNIANVEQITTEVQENKSRIEIEKSATEQSKIQNPKSKIVEWYENTANGLEQGWTISEKPAATNGGELNLVLELGGDLKPKLTADKMAIDFVRGKNEPVVRYDKLKSWDADGNELASRMELDDNTLSIVVDDADAKYPITVDPFFSQTKKLTASDAAAFDDFGSSVAISGDTAIVGARGDDDAGTSSGSAYIFERNTGGANMWGQVQKLTAADASTGDNFGLSVAISGDTAIVGSQFDDDAGTSSGSAYIFERNTGGANNWGQVQKIVAADAATGDNFGFSVAISGDTAIVGSQFDDDGGNSSGSAYIFERNTGGANMWGQVQKIVAADAAAGDDFGWSAAISGDTAIVGAVGDADGGSFSGSAYIFERNTGGANMWGQVQKIVASDAAADVEFGRSVAISGDTAIVGASRDDDTATDSGSAYIFERNTGGANNWGQVQKIVASDAAASDFFGDSVAISGDTAIVGARGDDDAGTSSGSAYIFERNTGGANMWGQVQKIVAADAAALDFFGISVSISGDTAIVGASADDDAGRNSGSAYVFTNVFNNWTQVASQTSSDGAAGDEFGNSVAISGDTAIVGAPFDDDAGSESGSAYIFERNTGGANMWGQVKKLVASDAAGGDRFGFSVAISGDTAIVGAYFDDDAGGASGSAYIFERNSDGAGGTSTNNWGQVKKIVASDAAAVDRFGYSVAISGDTAIVGSYLDDDAGSNSGSAYIFARNTGGANMWGQVKKIVASDAALGDQFGVSVAISGDTTIVGSYLDADAGIGSGSAYIFERNSDGAGGTSANNWGQVKKLVASDAAGGVQFGNSVAISGDKAIVGAYRNDDVPNDSGSAYIFERNTGGANMWGQVKKLVASDAAASDQFGFSVAISGDTAIVGANSDDDAGSSSGSAYIFARNTGGANMWGQVQKLVASDAAAPDQFGESVAISGDTAIVGAPNKDIAAPLSDSKQTNRGTGLSSKSSKQQSPNLAGAQQGGMYIFKALAAPTAANVSISGRVLSSVNGGGLPRATVHITDQSGNIRTAITNPFGYFRFTDIEAGQSLVVNVFHKEYQFSPQVVAVNGDLNNLDFTPQASGSGK